MSSSDEVFVNLRQKLDILGFTQLLPFSAVPIVSALLEDVVKTTESLRDAKKKIVDFLEEKSCWELGIEPYKCDNSRLLNECNQLRLQHMKEREDYEQRICDLNEKVRSSHSEKQHLEDHSLKLQEQLKLLLKQNSATTTTGRGVKENNIKSKKPFISTVRSNEKVSSNVKSYIKCTKCCSGYYYQPLITTDEKMGEIAANASVEQEKLEYKIKDLMEQQLFYKKKVEARDREIQRLNDLLVGGRPLPALAKDCCYKSIGALTQDVEHLQRDKSDCLNKIREYQDQMHEAMQNALALEMLNKRLHIELEELKETALRVESQANAEIEEQESELEDLRTALNNLQEKFDKSTYTNNIVEEAHKNPMKLNKRYLDERLNKLTQKEIGLNVENERLQKKIQKLKNKINTMQKDLQETIERGAGNLDEEKIKLKSERDFFQKEYLRMVSKSGSDKEIEFLQSQIKLKDEELRALRSELCMRTVASESENPICTVIANAFDSIPNSVPSSKSHSSEKSDCLQAVLLRAERDRDVLRKNLEQLRCEYDMLREKHDYLTQVRIEETINRQKHLDELNKRIDKLECENRDLRVVHMPSESQIVLMKDEIENLNKYIEELKKENCNFKQDRNQLRILHEQTEHSLAEYQKKLILAERQIDATNLQLNNLDNNREMTQNETTLLRQEVCALKRTYIAVEQEKDKLLNQLDSKTENIYQLEFELKSCQATRETIEKQVIALECQLQKSNKKSREHTSELHDTTIESTNLRQQITALKTSLDEAIAENRRLTNKLAESKAEVAELKKRLKSSDLEIEKLKQQLRQYVHEVKKAEDLLLQKEQEREEMLEHYRSLSHDAVLLEGNNQSLEVEAIEHKRQISELEAEIDRLKKTISKQNDIIGKLEDKVTILTTQMTCIERQLEEAIDDQRLIKVDLEARKELCDKLDNEKDKLNAELCEVNKIRQKLEKSIESSRYDTNKSPKTNSSKKTSVDALEELLVKTRRDLEEQIQVDSKLSLELIRLRQQNDELLRDLGNERDKCKQQEAFAHEYRVQSEELRHNLTDDRFRQALSREQSPRFPTQTL